METIILAGVVRFDCRDMGWYEDDPDYHYHGSIGSAFVDLAIPKLSNGSGRYKVTITIEPEPWVDHIWVNDVNGVDDVCVACGDRAFGEAGYGGVRYPDYPCPGEKE